MKRTLILLTALGALTAGGGAASASLFDDGQSNRSPICIGTWDDQHPDGRDGICILLPGNAH